MFTHLGIKTDYSLLKSLIKIKDLISYAKKNNISTLGILDDNLCGSHTFYAECEKNNIKCIIGLEIEIDNYSLYLYPKNMDGLINLFKLSKEKLDNIITIEKLKEYKDNVILVLPYQSIYLYDNVKNIFDIVFLSFTNEEERLNERIITDNIVYIKKSLALTKESSKYINYLDMTRNNLHLGDVELINYEEYVIKEEEYDTSSFTDLINIEFPKNKRYIPHYDESIASSFEYLSNLANKGLKKRLNNNVDKKYQDRLDYELSVINNMGFTDYFLIVFDYVRYAIKNDIYVGAGRGSAAGSLVAYSLGITTIDPIKYDLLFERFLNPERVTMPDIDVDFDNERRDEVIEYVRSRYGVDRVAKIMTYGTMTAREVLRVVGKINDVSENVLNILTKNIDSKKSLEENLTDEVKKILDNNSILKKVYNESYYLEGLKKHISTTAAGVVICSCNLDEVVPIVKSGDEYLIGYNKDEIESLGLLKMDFLSIKNLSIMTNILKDIEKFTNKKLNINNIPLDDKEVYEMFSSSDTVGIFQFESTGMKRFISKLKPKKFEDLIMAIAIYRPASMASIDKYIELHNGKSKITYIDDSLEGILKNTYGILVYQEQIMEILRFMGNFSYAEADIIRRAISKKKVGVIEESHDKFISNAIKNGYSETQATKIFDLIVKFADFGFNKSHSVAYALIAYQMAYLKVHYKEIFYINLLNINIGGEAKTKEYIEEAKKNSITFLKPDINLSMAIYSKESDGIRIPIRVIKGVGIAASDAIINKRTTPYKDFYDFISRSYGGSVNRKILEILIEAGVFDSFGYNRQTLLKNIASSLMYAELIKDLDESLVNKPVMEIYEEKSDLELMMKEKELFGYYVSTHPASKYPHVMKQVDIASYFDKIVETVVLLDKIKKIKTKNNKDMAFLTGSDETTSSEFVVFDDCLPILNSMAVGDLVKIKGHVEKRFDSYQIVVKKIEKI